ncbi:MAG: WD40 repeat domain-containing protein [Isosphaeraceae bacterium]
MLILAGHDERVRCLAYSLDGRLLVSCGSDWNVRLWDLHDGSRSLTISGHRRNVLGVVFSLEETMIISYGETLRIWDAFTGAELPRGDFKHPNSEDLTTVLLGWKRPNTASPIDARRAEATRWRLTTTRPRWLSSVELHGHRLARGMLSLEGGEPSIPKAEPLELRDGTSTKTLLVPVSGFGTRRGTFAPGLGWSLHFTGQIEACFTPDERTLAVTSDDDVHLWSLDEPRRCELVGHSDMVRALAFSPDGMTLATSGYDGTVRLWDVSDGLERACYDPDVGPIDALAFSPDGMTLAAGGKRGIVLWDAGEGF